MVQVPAPTIALAVLTCVPFGLAIRDTATGKYDVSDEYLLERAGLEMDHDDDDEDEEEDYRAIAARREAEAAADRLALAEREAEEEADRQQREALVRSLYGAELATLGSAFESIKLGVPIAESGTVRSTASVDLMLLDDGVTTHTLFIKIQRDYSGRDEVICTRLGAQLRETWGDPLELSGMRVWLNEAAAQRAVFDPERCELKFDKVATLESWISKTEPSLIPMGMVGKPAAKLIEMLGARTSSTIEDDEVTWSALGLGIGNGTTQLVATVRGGKVASVLASVQTSPQLQDRVIERISAIAGRPPDDLGVWKHVPRIAIEAAGSQLFVTIGTPPPVE